MSAGKRVAVVTGGNKGIGLAIVARLCREFDGDVYLTARDASLGRAAVARLEAEGLRPRFHQLDILSTDSIAVLKQHLVEHHGGLDVLVNNAGVAYKHGSDVPFLEQAAATMRTNFTATLEVSKALLPIVRDHGRVVNVSAEGRVGRLSEGLQERIADRSLTEAGLVALMEEFIRDVREGQHRERGWPGNAYDVSKAGRTVMSRMHARDLSGRTDVLVNSCCPGHTRTDMAGPKAPRSPEEAAETPCFLALLPAGSPSGEFWKDKALGNW